MLQNTGAVISIAFVMAIVTAAVPKDVLFKIFSGLATGLSTAQLDPFISNMHFALWVLAAISLLGAARAGVSTAGTRNNREYAQAEVGDVPAELVELAYDPQTAGGLLVSLPGDKSMALEAEFAAAGLFLARIGEAIEGAGTELV